MNRLLKKAYENKDFLLSPEAEPVRRVADSLYSQYLRNSIRKGHLIHSISPSILDEEFIKSPDGRWVRIIAETLYAEHQLKVAKVYNTIVFFGSARINETAENGETPHKLGRFYDEARELSARLTEWSLSIGTPESPQPFVICTGGGPSIMEAGNRGADDSGGKSIGLNISLPFEQVPNSYITPELNFEFHYFFTRKYHFAYRAKALVVFPGGFGSMDELFEMLTLVQNQKIIKKMKIILYGIEFWKKAINFKYLVDCGVISTDDLNLFSCSDSVEDSFNLLTGHLFQHHHINRKI